MTTANDLGSRCDLLRSLHRPGDPLVLPNVWDAATAMAVAAARFPAVATTSAGVAAALGYDDHEGAPAGEMLAPAARTARSVDVPVTVDVEAGYGMTAAELVAGLRGMGAAGCNLEDTDHAAQALRDPAQQAAWLQTAAAAAVFSSCSRSIRITIAGEGCWPFFLLVAMSSRAAMSRGLISWLRRWTAAASIASSVTAAPPIDLPLTRAGSWPSRVRSRMYSRSIPDRAASTVNTTPDGSCKPWSSPV